MEVPYLTPDYFIIRVPHAAHFFLSLFPFFFAIYDFVQKSSC